MTKRNIFIFWVIIVLLFMTSIVLDLAWGQDLGYLDPDKEVLTWDEPTTGGPVEGYRLYWGPETGLYSTHSVDITGTRIPMSSLGLAQGLRVYMVCRAYNSVGESGDSNEITFIPLSVPGVPTNLGT